MCRRVFTGPPSLLPSYVQIEQTSAEVRQSSLFKIHLSPVSHNKAKNNLEIDIAARAQRFHICARGVAIGT